MGGLHLCGCKDSENFWREQILEKESADKMKIEKEITQNSYFDRCEVRFWPKKICTGKLDNLGKVPLSVNKIRKMSTNLGK